MAEWRLKIDDRQSEIAIRTFPVVIGAGSHPFPFRTRKLSLLPPMVLRGKLRGRVGHCRDYLRESPRSSDDDGGLFFFCARGQARSKKSPHTYTRARSGACAG